MNRWKQVWNNRQNTIDISNDVYETYVELKKADGFDVQTESGYYEGLFSQWQEMIRILEEQTQERPKSVFEVCCGSGADLWLFSNILGIEKLAGLDYSEPLIEIASSVIPNADFSVGEALTLDTEKKYEWVISDSGFQYFPDSEYGMEVFEKMLRKADKAVVITEIHDLEKKEKHLAYRKSRVSNYDELYAGLEKTYYDKELFMDLARKNGYETQIIKPGNDAYWNNRFVFDLYCWR